MTVEIVVLNKEAVALAADSAVTISVAGGEKIFTAANKIFQLSEKHPVGAMVFNNAQLMGVPWETIINEMRVKLPQNGFGTLDEYVDFFINFLEEGKPFFPESNQEENLGYEIYQYFLSIVPTIVKAIDDTIKKRGPINDRAIQIIVSKVIRTDLEEWKEIKEDQAYSISMETSRKIARHYKGTIEKALQLAFQRIPISRKAKRNIFEISRNYISKGFDDDTNSGVVIAGFGENEVFPSVRSFLAQGIIGNKLKYLKGVKSKIGEDTDGAVIAFAQREMVSRFMEGVDPIYQKIEASFMSQIAEKFAEVVTRHLKKYSVSERKSLRTEIIEKCHKIMHEYREAMEKKRIEFMSIYIIY